ncbi:MAG: GNAT family N-acetyltransferase [Lachnospiraceae bacterium]
MVYKITQKQNAAALFEGWQESMIWSCMQGVMGELYADDPQHPTSAMVWLGDFCLFAGETSDELARFQLAHPKRSFMIMIPQTEEWGRMIENCYGERAKKVTRCATKKERDSFDRVALQGMVDRLSPEYSLRMIDRKLFDLCSQIPFSEDFVAQFADYEMYQRYGLGVMIFHDGEPVAGASSYSAFEGGIEIEIDTKAEYRRRGLATVCGAKLILECMDRGWYPSWDAQNPWSLALAEKLGYHFDREYTAYEICPY